MQFIILRDAEFCSGTFGYHGTGILGIFMTGVALYIISLKKLNKKYIFLILYLSLSPLIGSAKIFFVANFFLVPFILMKKYKVSFSYKVTLIILLCLTFLGLLRFNQLWYEEGETQPFNPFYYFSSRFYGNFFAERESTLDRGGAIIWAYSTLKDEVKLFAGRGVGWFRNLTSKQLAEFRKLTIGYEFPIVLLLCGIFGLLIFFYLASNLFKMRIRIAIANPELKFFILCLALLYLIGGIYTQGWTSKTTGYCFAMLIGILSNKNNKKYFIEKYLILNKRDA
jgi:hypothetical protein